MIQQTISEGVTQLLYISVLRETNAINVMIPEAMPYAITPADLRYKRNVMSFRAQL